jgi:hypothetical protein
VRWLIGLVVLMGMFAEARAELVVSDPPMVRRCPRAKTWDLVVKCLSKFGTVKVTRQFPRAKLATLYQKQGTQDVDIGLVFYVERNGEWQIGGRFETYGQEYRLLGIEPVTIGKKAGYRLEVGQTSAFTLMIDNVTPVPAQMRMKRILFCNGDSYACPEVIGQCEISVQGKTWFLFRGTLEYEDNVVNVRGDRTRGGVHCNIPPKIYLGWR